MAGLNPSIDYTAPLADRGSYNTAAQSTLADPPGMDGGIYIPLHTPTRSIYVHHPLTPT